MNGRRKRGIIKRIIFVLGIILFISFSCKQKQENQSLTSASKNGEVIRKNLVTQIDHFGSFLKDSLMVTAQTEPVVSKDLQRQFLKARLLFKQFEWAAEYFMGSLTRMMNGPPDQEVENADLLDPSLTYAIDPMGLQIVEELIFPDYRDKEAEELYTQLSYLYENTKVCSKYFTTHQFADWRILDAAKMEVFRIITLGITGFDNPLTLKSSEEAAVSLGSLKEALSQYKKTSEDLILLENIDQAIDYLNKNQDFDDFDRAEFITKYANKISSAIAHIQEREDAYRIQYNRLLRQEARTLFDSDAYNVNAFAPGTRYHLTRERAELGKRLFFDNRLSGDGTRSCASCHLPTQGFADALKTNTDIHTGAPLPRNTPTLLNAALQSNQFYDMRELTLEDQARNVIQNPDEMDGSLVEVVKKLSEDSIYREMFAKAYPDRNNPAIDTFQIMNALASYIRGELTQLNSRFDEYMQGDKTALSEKEIRGFNLFMGKAKCATCHFMPLFNGTTPPKFVETETEVIGVPLNKEGTGINPDLGWYNTIGIDSYKYAFKTPTVRNVDQTAPYMHNGVYSTLEEVMDFYNNAGAIGLGFELPNQTLPEDSLHLTTLEISDVIAFMKSLNSQGTTEVYYRH